KASSDEPDWCTDWDEATRSPSRSRFPSRSPRRPPSRLWRPRPIDSTPSPRMTTNVDELVALLRGRRVGVLTGAGISTESGIPDYRGPETRRRARNPIQWREFVSSEAARRRYWARALVGWSRFANKAPAAGHLALAELERSGIATGVV